MFKHVTGRFTTARGFATGLVAGIMLTTTVTTALAAAPIKEALVGFYNVITVLAEEINGGAAKFGACGRRLIAVR